MVGIPTSACLHFCPAFDRLVDAHSQHLKQAPTRPGRCTGTANPISSSLAYSLHENQSAVIALSKKSRPSPRQKQPGLSATPGRNKTPAPLRLWISYRLSLLAWLASRCRLRFLCDRRRLALPVFPLAHAPRLRKHPRLVRDRAEGRKKELSKSPRAASHVAAAKRRLGQGDRVPRQPEDPGEPDQQGLGRRTSDREGPGVSPRRSGTAGEEGAYSD